MTQAQLKTKIAKIQKEKKEELKKRKEEKLLKYYQSTSYVTDLAKEETITKLNKIHSDLEVVYQSLDRKIIAKYGYSVVFDKLITIAGSIKYLPLVEKEVMLRSTGISEVSIEELLDAVGNTAYYSKESHTIVEAISFDRDRVALVLQKLEVELSIELVSELDLVTQKKLDYLYTRGRNNAEEMYNNTEAMIVESQITYDE